MSNTTTKEMVSATRGFLSDASQLGQDLMDSAMRRGRQLMPRRSSSCDVPEPCWMPQRLDPVHSFTCPGATARLRINITNCGLDSRSIEVGALYDDAMGVEPKSVVLRPFETGQVNLTYPLPADVENGSERRVIVGVVGCKAYLLDWTISVRNRGVDSCHEIEIEDCPDVRHHWYDHFYCQRPCIHAIASG